MTTQLLTDEDFDRLSDLLELFGDRRSMNVEQIDGFLAAVVCGPEVIPPDEYLRAIWGDDIINEDVFKSKPLLAEFISLVKQHHDSIADTLLSGDIVMPVLAKDEDGIAHGNDWANGFVRGIGLRKEGWAPLLDDEENSGCIVPILALANEFNPDPAMRPYKKPITRELRERLIIHAAAAVVQIFHYFEAPRLLPELASDDSTAHSSTYRGIAQKIGRNEPCPCGSGKKFKHCCGTITLH
jgi:uncharacterized protein